MRAAADATANASGFAFTLPSVEVTYNAPDRVQQVEHGEASTAGATNGGGSFSSSSMPATITKIFVADRYYEANSIGGAPASFTVSQRCPNENAADAVLRVLRSIAVIGQATASGSTYTFTVPAQGSNTETTGTLTIVDGFVHVLTVSSGTPVPTVTLESVGSAPSVTEPTGASPSNVTCG